ncbi:hypothetical protein B296_00058163 [Ensete ventricosum]|uniref:fructokinase n=1 Tax=Ensete ventricosum TaxID=4639 RepID=A0A426WXY7_ENSVE|nr:hypothetical protein B296_00058163 [Ensete ventricosum]
MAKDLIVSFGEMLIDFVPTVSGVSLAEAPGFIKAPGGAPANVAIAVARIGGRAAFVGKLGDDDADMLLTEGELNLDVIKSVSPISISLSIRRAVMTLASPPQAAVFHYGSISLITEPCRSAHLKAMEVAREAGALLSYDPNLRLPLWPSAEEAREQILSIWDQADIIKVSDVELEFLTGQESVEDDVVLTLWRPAFKLLVVTLGEKGCKYYTKDFRGSLEGYAVDTVDTTGAGDAFVGAMLRKIVDDQTVLQVEGKLREVLKFANACGAITTTEKGAIPALPTEPAAVELLKRH